MSELTGGTPRVEVTGRGVHFMKLILLSLLAIFVLAAEQPAFEARKQKVRVLLEQREFNAALAEAGALNKEWPDDVAIYQLLAEAQLGLGRYGEAEKTIQWMLDLRIGKADAPGWLVVARFREATGDREGALDAVNLSYERLAPGQDREAAELLAYAGRLHLALGHTAMAKQAMDEALKKFPALGDAHRLSKKPESADEHIVAIEARLKKTPLDLALKNELAGAYLRKMRETADGAYLERAQRIVKDVLRSGPENYGARRLQIEIELQQHHFRQVIALAKELIKVRREDAAVWGLMGDAMMELGEYDSAADAYQKMSDLRPGLASYNRIAFYRFVTGDAEGAIEIMRRGIDLGAATPENLAWYLSDLGMMLYKTGKLDEAEKSFRTALNAFPKYHNALGGLGYVFMSQGRFGDAIQSFKNAQDRAPLPEYTAALARLYRRTGQEMLAKRQIALLEVAAKLDQAAGEMANRNLALAFADVDGQSKRALEIAQAELKVRQDVYSWDALAWAQFKSGDVQAAAESIRNALCQNTPEPLFHRHAARIFEALGETEKARRHEERVAALNPGYPII